LLGGFASREINVGLEGRRPSLASGPPAGSVKGVPDEELPRPEPKEIDSAKWLEWKDVMDRAILRAHPLVEFGREYRCDNCYFYLDPDADLSYCWHPNLRILVGGSWWCQWWEEIPAEN
jgi:hypothetical protein